jgi:hypothetical protein
MAGILLAATSGEQAIANGKTLLQVVAAAGHRVTVQGWSISIKGTSATDPPVLVQLVRQTTAGTMSAGTTGTNISKKNDTDAETIQTTTRVNATVEPTTTDVVESFEVHPQTGYRVFYPMGQEITIPNGERLGIKVTSATLTYSATANMDLVE